MSVIVIIDLWIAMCTMSPNRLVSRGIENFSNYSYIGGV